MKREDLKNIRSLQELEAARRVIGKSMRRRQDAIGKDLSRVQHMFTPSSLVGAGLHLVAPATRPINHFLLGMVRGLKSALRRWS